MQEKENQSYDVGGLQLESPVMIGAGPIKLPEHVWEIARSDAAAILVGSITVEARTGNAGQTYFTDTQRRFSLNARGLPNPGMSYYQTYLPEMVRIAHDHGKPLIVSVAGFSPTEYVRLVEVSRTSGADGTEVNLGCPNVWGGDGKQKRIASFDQDVTGEILYQIEQSMGTDGWTAVKLSPFSDPAQLERMASLICNFQLVNAVTTTNTFPNAFAFTESGNQALDLAGGFGGMAGEAMKAIGLGQVKQLRACMPSNVAVIGAGGITNTTDMEDYLRVEAAATQVTTGYMNIGPSIFHQIHPLKRR